MSDSKTDDETTPPAGQLPDSNSALIVGAVRAEPRWFDRPEGRACCFEIQTRSGTEPNPIRIPVAWLEPGRRSSIVRPGNRLAVAGRLDQRFFRSNGRIAVRIEVLAERVLSTRSRARVLDLLGAVPNR